LFYHVEVYQYAYNTALYYYVEVYQYAYNTVLFYHVEVYQYAYNTALFYYVEVYQYAYNTALYCVVVYAVPLLVVGVFNLRLVASLADARRNWVTLNSSQKRELRATRLPVVIVLVFAVCGSVSLLGFVLDAVYASVVVAAGGRYPPWLQAYTAVSNCLVVFNAAVNFLLMLCFGKKFRRMLSDAVHCRKSPTRMSLAAAAAASTTMAAERVRSRSIVACRETIF